MGFLNSLGMGRDKGVQCTRNPDGSETCTRFQLDKNGNKISTGSEVTITVDPSTCKASLGGEVNSLLDDEKEDFNAYAKASESRCRRGIA